MKELTKAIELNVGHKEKITHSYFRNTLCYADQPSDANAQFNLWFQPIWNTCRRIMLQHDVRRESQCSGTRGQYIATKWRETDGTARSFCVRSHPLTRLLEHHSEQKKIKMIRYIL